MQYARRLMLVGTGLVVLACAPALAIDADDQWGVGFYSAYPTGDPNEFHFDITLQLASIDTLAGLVDFAAEGLDETAFRNTVRYTGLHWQPDGGNLLNSFVPGTFNPIYVKRADGTTSFFDPATLDTHWVHDPPDGLLGQVGIDGQVGLSVDQVGFVTAGPPNAFELHAENLAEWGLGIPLHATQETLVRFGVDVIVPDGVGVQNALMGWTAQKWETGEDRPNRFIQAQNSTVLTPELPTLGLMVPTLLGCAGFYWRRLRYRAK